MADRNTTYDASEQETFGWVDDEEQNEEGLEEDILDARDYREADRFGMTPEEERRGSPLADQLAAEVPEDQGDPREPGPGDPVPDEPDPFDPVGPNDPDPNRPLPDEPAPPQPW
ncbi:hypothetical protein [Glycomyces terrestris]|uniref:Uncharacterized protein n=1 Tax=Glycomyces terrestris TaxID=2493553 RepID=A0A426UYC9_9ACTN|nr:hypothetical protein [Glycomyces terrestris]RRR99574.1 hypothetical protein EIW28_12820 [Glycomyces terrestris]